MEISEQQEHREFHKEEEYSENGGLDTVYETDDSEDPDDSEDLDPSFNVLEETHAKLSNLSITKKKAKSRIGKVLDPDSEGNPDGVVGVPEIDEKDEKSFEKVQKLIEAGQVEKLKVDQCKVYLRKNGLRLTGNKDTLIQRIKEHFEIMNGGGEKKYPVSSFVLNCKGDACTGDIVMFEQNVYEMFNIASRSASGPPCGTRFVAGRIVKESYGAAKQQHTFTIEVLWSKGEKPLPPLHPLLIKGRNLYRLKTLRQRWEDEGERQRALMEKHSRGSLARSDREARIQEKEMRKMAMGDRTRRKEPIRNVGKAAAAPQLQQPVIDSSKLDIRFHQSGKPVPQSQHGSSLSVNSGKAAAAPQLQQPVIDSSKLDIRFHQSGKPVPQSQHGSSLSVNSGKSALFDLSIDYGKQAIQHQLQKNQSQNNYQNQTSQNSTTDRMCAMQEVNWHHMGNEFHTNEVHLHHQRADDANYKRHNFYTNDHLPISKYPKTTGIADRMYSDTNEVHLHHQRADDANYKRPNFYANDHKSPPKTTGISDRIQIPNRQPLRSMNYYCPAGNPPYSSSTQVNMKRQLCKYYGQGRCYFGDNCKFLHN